MASVRAAMPIRARPGRSSYIDFTPVLTSRQMSLEVVHLGRRPWGGLIGRRPVAGKARHGPGARGTSGGRKPSAGSTTRRNRDGRFWGLPQEGRMVSGGCEAGDQFDDSRQQGDGQHPNGQAGEADCEADPAGQRTCVFERRGRGGTAPPGAGIRQDRHFVAKVDRGIEVGIHGW